MIFHSFIDYQTIQNFKPLVRTKKSLLLNESSNVFHGTDLSGVDNTLRNVLFTHSPINANSQVTCALIAP